MQARHGRRQHGRRFTLGGRIAMVFGVLLSTSGIAPAETLPSSAELQAALGPPGEIIVYEPSRLGEGRFEVGYRGYPAADVLAGVIGENWQAAGNALEFRALDGYVSVIPVERFARYAAWLVFARTDGGAFEITRAMPAREQIPLGPWYLVWDNREAAELVAEGARYWPWQATEVRLLTGVQ